MFKAARSIKSDKSPNIILTKPIVIMNDNGIITIHDTDESYMDNFVELEGHKGDDTKGPSDFVKTIDKEKFEVINFFNHGIRKDKPSSTGLTIVRKK